MSKIDLKSLKKKAKTSIKKAKDLEGLDVVSKQFLGKKSELSLFLRSLSGLSKAKKAKSGKEANELKIFIRQSINKKSDKIKLKKSKTKEKGQWIDVTIPGEKQIPGHLHILTQGKKRVEDIFKSMGFSVVGGPQIETEWYNFDALNIPKDHPARDLWDTLYLKGGNLLRTHTSPVQIRFMEKNQPPLRIIVPGRVFRREATDASHEIDFFQIEGLMVGETVSVANFKAIMQEFYKDYFERDVKIRLRPGYFPFVEPGFEIDCSCVICRGKGCSVCSRSGWLEMMGAGMVHPNVLKNSGLSSKKWQGFAFGFGLERLVMIKHKINDIRLFYGSDLRFLKQF
jgi:phenylalanyl-tRNA synthetase alpha chain